MSWGGEGARGPSAQYTLHISTASYIIPDPWSLEHGVWKQAVEVFGSPSVAVVGVEDLDIWMALGR